jgi:hypothetical protein
MIPRSSAGHGDDFEAAPCLWRIDLMFKEQSQVAPGEAQLALTPST